MSVHARNQILNTRYIFFGTSRFAVYVLDELKKAGSLPVLIVTAPDRPAGRGLKLTPPPVKVWALQNNIQFIQPEKLEIGNWKLEIAPVADLYVVAAYGKILPRWLLNTPKHGALNVHPSLLPKYRGPSPVQTQILTNEKEIGVTIILMDEKVDHGKIIADCGLPIADLTKQNRLTAPMLEELLARGGGRLLAQTIPDWTEGKIRPREQNHGMATFTKKITKTDGLIDEKDIKANPLSVYLKLCAYNPWPGVHFFRDKKRIKITQAVYENGMLKDIRVVPEGSKETAYKKIDGLRYTKEIEDHPQNIVLC